MTRCCGNSPRAVTTASSPEGEPPDLAAGQTDKHVDAVPDLVERVRNEISKSLSRFSSESAGWRFTSATNTPVGAATNSGLRGQRGRVVSAFWRGSFVVTVLDGRPLSCRGSC